MPLNINDSKADVKIHAKVDYFEFLLEHLHNETYYWQLTVEGINYNVLEIEYERFIRVLTNEQAQAVMALFTWPETKFQKDLYEVIGNLFDDCPIHCRPIP